MYVYLYVYNAIIVKKETLNSKERREYLMRGGWREGRDGKSIVFIL